jgi:carboxymethylenebutenolidase
MVNKRILLIVAAVTAVTIGILYWSDARVDFNKEKGAADIREEEATYFDGVSGFFVRPADDGEYPGVVMVHEWWGLNDSIRNEARELAKEGYMVLAVDLYKGEVATTPDRSQELVRRVVKEEAVDNMRSAVAYLRDKGALKIASLGWCFGGGKSLELALSGEELDATVIYYGQLVTDANELKKISWPVLGVFGEEDASIPVATVEAFRSGLVEAGVVNEIYIYPGVGHAFANPTGNNYSPEETEDAWNKTRSFLKNNL